MPYRLRTESLSKKLKSSTRLRAFEARAKRNSEFLSKVDIPDLIDEIDFALNIVKSALWHKESEASKKRFDEALAKKEPIQHYDHGRSFHRSELLMACHSLLYILRQELDK